MTSLSRINPDPRLGRKNLDHGTPPWIDADASDFFLTICCQHRGRNQLCLPGVSDALLGSARFYHDQRKWFPAVFLLMLDHLHMIVRFGREHEMPKVIAAWKRYAASKHSIVWQQGFFDHRLRRDESWEEKADYILQNPVRAGLVEREDQWPHVLRLDDYSGRES